jgi:ABC-type dipeptide/oligopeptide/nickel transport system permease subunit
VKLAWLRLTHDRRAIAAAAVLALLCLVALCAPLITPYDPARQLDIIGLKDQPPSWAHWFGTDPFGRDVLSRVLFGGRVSLGIAVLAAFAATTVGVAYGALAGAADGATDDIMMRLVDVCLALPRILVLLAVIALWGHVSVFTLVLLLGLTGWFTLSRMVRAEMRSIRQREYVTAARALGASRREVTLRHVLPNLASTVITWATLDVGQVILLEAGLSFLGLGVQPPTPSWGNIMQDGADRLATLWWMSCFPGLMILITVGAVTLLGDRLREALDPRELPAP